MDRNATMERRFSLNMTHLPNPIAESTCVNLNGSGHTGNAIQFRWGSSPISCKNQSNSNDCLNNTNALNKSRGATSPQRTRMNLSKIDPRIYADVQSKGLASRIVQYHENGTRLNRSMSANNLYSKPGHFPALHLQKSDLPYRATQQNVSMTRIAPPEKSVFRGNTLSSLLRSNSVISLQKTDDEISRENRPILHPPATEGDLAPTRSVLDVLKEISRKRINSDDSDSVHDTTKKYCSRDCNDAPLYEVAAQNADARNMGSNMHPILHPPQCFKRQRESVTQQQQFGQFTHVNSATMNAATFVGPTQVQHSPEQIAKKRLCSYNNDITSSLSSSLMHTNKRKLYEQQRIIVQHSPPSVSEDYETQKSKIQRQQSDLRLQQLTKSLSCVTPITPIPDTPIHQNVESLQPISPNVDNTAGLPKRTVSEPPYTKSLNSGDMKSTDKPQKPRLTLFNKNYDEAAEVRTENRDTDSLENNEIYANGECAIQFVKPKKSSSILNTKNPVIERTQKSKLALMLSGLRGELYLGNEDEVDQSATTTSAALPPNASNISTISNNFNATVSPANMTNTTISTTTASAVISSKDKSSLPSTVANGKPPTSAAPPIIAPIVTSTTTTTASNATTVTAPALAMGGFKFTPSTATVTSSGTTPQPTAAVAPLVTSKTSSPLVGIKLTPQTPAPPDLAKGTSTSVPLLNFGAPTVNNMTNVMSSNVATATYPQLTFTTNTTNSKTVSTQSAAITTLTTPAPLPATTQASGGIGGFKFGATTVTTTATAPVSSTAPVFGSFTGIKSMTNATTAPVAASSTVPTFAFSSVTNTVASSAQPTFNFGTTSTAVAPAFNFGASTANATTTTLATVVKESTPALSSTQFSAPNQPNVFNAPSNAFAPPPATKSFTFGVTPSVSTVAATPATAAIATNTFSFGGSNTAPQNPSLAPAAFSFGTNKPAVTTMSTSSAAPFAFGSTAQTTTTSAMSTSPTSAPTSVFGFGASQMASTNAKQTTVANSNAPASNLFAFNPAAVPASTAAQPTNAPKAFGSLATNNANNNQTNITMKPNAFTFGSMGGAGPTTQQPPPAFGAANTAATPFAFGAANQNKPNTATSTGGFNFGNVTSGPTAAGSASTNFFGAAINNSSANTSSTTAPATNIVKPSFSFGGNTNVVPPNTDASKSLFGGITANNTNSNNSFGSLATANTNHANKAFSFGSNTESAPTNNVNIFGAAATNKPATGGFSFNANTTGNILNKTTTANVPNAGAFPFGNSNNTNANNSANAPFSFGGNNGGAANNKAFNFGSGTTAPSTANAGSIFGGGAALANAAESTQSAATPFTLTSGTPNAAPAAAPPTNLFAPSMSNGPESRPIRRATRRLQKT